MAYTFQFPDISQHYGQHPGFFEPHSHEHRLDSEPTSHFSSGSHETAKGSYCALEEELNRTVVKLGTVEQDLAKGAFKMLFLTHICIENIMAELSMSKYRCSWTKP